MPDGMTARRAPTSWQCPVISYCNDFAVQLGGVQTIDTLGARDSRVADAATWIAERPPAAQTVPAEDWHSVDFVERSAPVVLFADEGSGTLVEDQWATDEYTEETERDQDPFTAGAKVNIQF